MNQHWKVQSTEEKDQNVDVAYPLEKPIQIATIHYKLSIPKSFLVLRFLGQTSTYWKLECAHETLPDEFAKQVHSYSEGANWCLYIERI